MKPSRIEPDSRTITLLSLALVIVLATASFTLSFLGLMEAAAWAGIPVQLRWLVPIVVDSTILVYAVAASVQRARGESTRMSWIAVGFFTAVSVAANGSHVLAPGGVPQPLSGPVLFGAFLAAIMPISLFFATHTTVALAVAPAYGSVAQRRKRARSMLTQKDRMDHQKDQLMDHPAAKKDHQKDRSMDQRWTTMDHPDGPPPKSKKSKAPVDTESVRRLDAEGLSQRAIAERLSISKTSVARVLREASNEPSAAPVHSPVA